jgi:Ca-activated chloride channel family protein
MAIIYWWLLPIWLLGIASYVVYTRKKITSTRRRAVITVAHASRFTEMSSYKKIEQNYRRLVRIIVLGAVIAICGTILLSTRPARQTLIKPEQRNRDIMLCLDVSGSMFEVDAKLFERFEQLVNGFAGQRIGLAVFNETAVSIFPLTDDYDLMREELRIGFNGFSTATADTYGNINPPDFGTPEYDDYLHITGGTRLSGEGASLAGDGLASCIGRMGNNETKRSQSIIFATDNEVNGEQIVTTSQAAAFAKEKSIRVYAVDPGMYYDDNLSQKDHDELRQSVLTTGGAYYKLDDPSTIPDVINKISEQEATYYAGTPELASADSPGVLIVVVLVSLSVIIVISQRLNI